jgi:hypothetical protein
LSERLFFGAVSRKTEVTDAHEAISHDVKQEATEKPLSVKGDSLFSFPIIQPMRLWPNSTSISLTALNRRANTHQKSFFAGRGITFLFWSTDSKAARWDVQQTTRNNRSACAP